MLQTCRKLIDEGRIGKIIGREPTVSITGRRVFILILFSLTGPHRGEPIPVVVDTHVTGSLEFENGAIVTITTSFDVWDSEMPRIEIYGTEGTICLNDPDPLDGPNLFGGPVLLRTKKEYRWGDFPRSENHPRLDRSSRDAPVQLHCPYEEQPGHRPG